MKFTLCIPTWNSEKKLAQSLEKLRFQTVQPDEFWVIDSASSDRTVELVRSFGGKVKVIPQSEFNHGATRNLFLDLSDSDLYIFMTDDAIFANEHSLEKIVSPFYEDPQVVVAYGRQLPHANATPFAAHARLFNYPPVSIMKSNESISTLGIKTVFSSNSFSAYRRDFLKELGGFPAHVILAEDTYVAAKAVIGGYKVAYSAEATVYHSHNYSIWKEFQRYFDIGIFYHQEKWILDYFGKAGGEGKKFVLSELRYLKQNGCYLKIPEWFLRNGMKWLGYKLGGKLTYFPNFLRNKLSMHLR